MTNEEIKKYYHGAYRFEETEDGYLLGIQYTKEQMKYMEFFDFFHERCSFGNAKTLEFVTEATEVSFDYKFKNGVNETIELAIDDIIYESRRAKDIAKCGKMVFSLPEGKKNVVIYLTADDVTYIKNLEINKDAEPVEKKTKVLWMGDSITQGYGPFRSGSTYVSVANRALRYEVLNQGIGGYYFDKNVLLKMEGYTPDKIIIAHGTNQCLKDDREEELKAYFERLAELYPNIPTLVITPVFRGMFSNEIDAEKSKMFFEFCDMIKEVAGKYDNIKVVDGLKLLHREKEYFMPDWLHPNALGCEVYGRNLVEEIRKIGF